MFRKPKKPKKSLRKREVTPDGEAEEDSVQETIRQTQKKQKILSALPMVTGRSTLPEERNISQEKSAPGELSVLEKKHHEAMKDYVNSHLHEEDPQRKK